MVLLTAIMDIPPRRSNSLVAKHSYVGALTCTLSKKRPQPDHPSGYFAQICAICRVELVQY